MTSSWCCLKLSATRLIILNYVPANWARFLSLSRTVCNYCINALRPRQNRRHFADDIFKCISVNENVWIPIKISEIAGGIRLTSLYWTADLPASSNSSLLKTLTQWGPEKIAAIFQTIFSNVFSSMKMYSPKFVSEVRINNIPALVQIMASRRPGDKPLSEPMTVSLLTLICVTRHQWVNIHKMIFFWKFTYFNKISYWNNVFLHWVVIAIHSTLNYLLFFLYMAVNCIFLYISSGAICYTFMPPVTALAVVSISRYVRIYALHPDFNTISLILAFRDSTPTCNKIVLICLPSREMEFLMQ